MTAVFQQEMLSRNSEISFMFRQPVLGKKANHIHIYFKFLDIFFLKISTYKPGNMFLHVDDL